MIRSDDIARFHEAQDRNYSDALAEIRRGRKTTHWMWYVFPQLRGLGHSAASVHYGLDGLEEAKRYFADPVLSARLVEISEALLQLNTDSAWIVLGRPDDVKLQSCMTLFEVAAPQCDVFAKVLEKYFKGERDRRTLKRLGMRFT